MCYDCRKPCKSCNEMTEFPKVYSNSYWGAFRSCSRPDENIFKNRNEFGKIHQLLPKQVSYNYKNKMRDLIGLQYDKMPSKFDHDEYYKTADDHFIVVVSITPESKDYLELIAEGWTPVDPLYSNSSVSLMIKLDLSQHVILKCEQQRIKQAEKKAEKEAIKEQLRRNARNIEIMKQLKLNRL